VQDDGAKVPLLESEQQYILHCSSTAAQSALASASYHYPRASYNTIDFEPRLPHLTSPLQKHSAVL
jgi:hypothetical protein